MFSGPFICAMAEAKLPGVKYSLCLSSLTFSSYAACVSVDSNVELMLLAIMILMSMNLGSCFTAVKVLLSVHAKARLPKESPRLTVSPSDLELKIWY